MNKVQRLQIYLNTMDPNFQITWAKCKFISQANEGINEIPSFDNKI